MKFGLDRLGIGSSDASTNKTTGSGSSTSSGSAGVGNTKVSAGKYVAQGVYIGLDQGISGESRAKVEVEINRNVTANTTQSAQKGTSVGLNWKLDY
jgi:translocation and assembly module TamB